MQRNIRKKRLLNVPIKDVWDALSNSNKLEKWFMEGNFSAEESFIFNFLDVPGEKWQGVFHGEVISAQPPINLAYSWTHNKLKHTTYVWWKLEDVAGKTVVEIEHSGFKGLADYWQSYSYARFWARRLKMLEQFVLSSNPVSKERTEL